MAGRHRGPRTSAASGFGLKWNMGWMHDIARATSQREPIHRQYHHNEMTFAMVYACSEHFVLPISPRRGRARQGLAARQDARRPLAAARQPARLPGLHVGAPGQAAAVHGLASSRQDVGVVRASAASTGGCSSTRTTPASAALRRDLNARVPRAPRRCGSRTTTPAGFEWIDANDAGGQRRSRWLRWGDDGAVLAVHRQLRRRCRTRATASACRSPAAGTRCSTPTPRRTAARAWATSAASRPRSTPWHGRPASAEIILPPLATVWLRYDGAEAERSRRGSGGRRGRRRGRRGRLRGRRVARVRSRRPGGLPAGRRDRAGVATLLRCRRPAPGCPPCAISSGRATSPMPSTRSASPSTTWRRPRACRGRTSAGSSGGRSGSRRTPTC